jgi:hypothetical protein
VASAGEVFTMNYVSKLSNSKNAPDKLKRASTKRGAAYGQHSVKSPQHHFTQVI